MLLFPLVLALGAPLPAGAAPTLPLDPGWIRWRDDGHPRAARRLEHATIGRRTRVEVRELDTGRTFDAEVDGHAILSGDAPLDDARSRALGVRVVRTLLDVPGAHLTLIASPLGEDGLTLAARLADRAAVVPDLWLRQVAASGQSSFDDPLLMAQWYVARMGLEAAWALEAGDPAVRIAINDNGCDLAHPDLAAQIDPGTDVIDGDDDPSFHAGSTGNEHGTACAGLVAAAGNNGVGIVGTCPRCRLRCVRLLAPDDGLVATSADVDAFAFALREGVAVSSNSWGFAQRMAVPGPIRTAITAFIEGGRGGRGGIVVFAAGNDNRALDADEITGIDRVITVAAVNNFDEPTSFTNFGTTVDLAAPTGSFTTDISGAAGDGPDDYTSHFGGTSSACPLVAGIFGLLASAAPEASGDELAMAMRAGLRPAPFATPGPDGHDLKHGFGLADPAAALRILLPPAPDAGVADDATVVALDAGVVEADAGEDDATTPTPEPESGCGCTTGTAPDVSLLGLAWFAAFAHRRSRARSA